MVDVTRLITKRHIIKLDEHYLLSIALLNFLLAGNEKLNRTINKTFPNSLGFININNLPGWLQAEAREVINSEEFLTPKINHPKNRQVDKPSRIKDYLVEDLRLFTKYVDYFKDIFLDEQLAIQKAKSVCIHKHFTTKINQPEYLKISYEILDEIFPDCEFLGGGVKEFRKKMIRYKKAGLLNALTDSSL